MKQFLPLLVFATTTALAQARLPTPTPTDDPHVLELTQNANLMTVTYQVPAAARAQLARRAQASHWLPAHEANEAAKLPEGGTLTVAWARPTAAQAAAKNFSLIILDGKGHELQRAKLTSEAVEPLDLGGTLLYPQSAQVPLPHLLPTGAKVFVIEAPVSKRYEYLIRL